MAFFTGFLKGPWLPWPKFLYFMLNFSVYASYSFFFDYINKVYGVSYSAYGIMNSLTVISFFSSIAWTSLADNCQRHTFILIFAAVAYASAFLSLWIAQSSMQLYSQATRNLFVTVVYVISNIFISALYPILDNRIMFLLSQKHRNLSKDLYGRQRLWGCIGQTSVALVTGYAMECFGYPGMFAVMMLSTIIFIASVVFFERSTLRKSSHQVVDVNASSPLKTSETMMDSATTEHPFKTLITNPRFDFLMFLVLVGGIVRGIVGTYLQPYLKRYYDVGLVEFASLTVSRNVTEIGGFFIGKPLLEYFGPDALLLMGIVAGAVRIGSYGFLPSGHGWSKIVLGIELLKGLNQAFIVVGGIRIAHDIAPRGAEATAQGFFSGIHGNLSNSVAGLFGSFVLTFMSDSQDSLRHLFRIAFLLSFSVAVAYLLSIIYTARRKM